MTHLERWRDADESLRQSKSAGDLGAGAAGLGRVRPAAGDAASAVELTVPELEACAKALGWVDVCKDWDPDLR